MFTSDTYDADGVTVVIVTGDVDLATADRLLSAIQGHLGRSARVVVDCSQIEFIDSIGLQALARAREEAQGLGTDFVLAAAPPHFTRILELAGLDGLFTIQPSAPARTHAWASQPAALNNTADPSISAWREARGA